MALKIAEQDSVERLNDKERALTNALVTGLTISPVEEVFQIAVDNPDAVEYGTVIGAALLLSPVGTPLSHPATQEEVQRLFELLWQLHTKGFPHGDPRVSNVIVSEGKLLWIDLFDIPLEPMEATTKLKVRDAKILTRSVLQLDYEDALGPACTGAVDQQL